MRITIEEVRHIAALARVGMTDEEVDYCAVLLQQAAVAISRALAASPQAAARRTPPADSPKDASEDEA